MGKYMKKSKITGDIAVMEVTQSTALGVRTRARTLALQRLHQQSPSPTTTTAAVSSSSPPNPDTSSSFYYLELRSRRLEKPLSPPPPASKTQAAKVKLCGGGGERKKESGGRKGGLVECEALLEAEDMGGAAVEASFGENCLDFEPRERSTRESTPCSLIRDPEAIRTPGSTTRRDRSNAATRATNVVNAVQGNIPTTREMEEFFSCLEQQQQRLFMEKYNFDVVNDLPLSGRYEWAQVVP
ncbi:hypothetical protein Tsubulata_013920 [Turnera subulata]|uniref:Cyclin-dependent kinase inhibitor domain-containing protein n=1 Tax=Turnera subulata TaxID=218843 RepID=A0A9Q0GCP5_9ROSI|nr:hypothetical protein Tsubulata_013920 [Turnera subulata]